MHPPALGEWVDDPLHPGERVFVLDGRPIALRPPLPLEQDPE